MKWWDQSNQSTLLTWWGPRRRPFGRTAACSPSLGRTWSRRRRSRQSPSCTCTITGSPPQSTAPRGLSDDKIGMEFHTEYTIFLSLYSCRYPVNGPWIWHDIPFPLVRVLLTVLGTVVLPKNPDGRIRVRKWIRQIFPGSIRLFQSWLDSVSPETHSIKFSKKACLIDITLNGWIKRVPK